MNGLNPSNQGRSQGGPGGTFLSQAQESKKRSAILTFKNLETFFATKFETQEIFL